MIIGFFVRLKGLEPPRLSAPDPKSGAATNYATTASFVFSITGAKIQPFFWLIKHAGCLFHKYNPAYNPVFVQYTDDVGTRNQSGFFYIQFISFQKLLV